MTSEIRANTLKNRVGLGTVSFTNTGPVVSGIVTANTLRLPNATSGSLGRLQLGNGLHFSMYHDGSNSFLVNNNGYLSIQSQAGVNGIFIARNAEVNLYYGPSVRLQTSSSGVTINRDLDVDGQTNLDNVDVVGIVTVSTTTQYHGYKLSNGSNLVAELVGLSGSNDTGALALWSGGSKYVQLSAIGNSFLNGGNFAIAKDLDVDGHTNLDNVSVAGVTTSTGNIYADNYFGNSGLTLNNNGNPSVNLTSTSTGGSSRINFGDPDSTTVGKIYYNHSGDYMYFSTAYNERLRIDSSGNFNLGLTASPVSSSTEQGVYLAGADSTQSVISSNVTPFVINRMGTGGNDRNCIEFRNNGVLRGTIGAIGASNGIFFQSATSEVLRIDSSGRVLIGTTNNTSVGSIDQNVIIGSTTNNEEVALTLNVIEGTNNRRVKFFLDDNDGVFGVDGTASTGVPAFVVRSATSEKLRINQNGKVIIGNNGTTFGNAAVQAFIQHGNTAGESGFSSVDTSSVAAGVGGEIAFHGKYNTGAQDYAYYGHIRGVKENAINGNTACALTFHTRPNATAPIERLRILSDGKLLIGSTNPSNNSRLGNELCIVGTEAYTGMSISNYPGTNASHAPLFDFNRSRGTSDQSMTSVAGGDKLGELIFRGSNGSAFADAVALRAYADSVGGGHIDGRYEISTSQAGNMAIRFRVNENGHITAPNNVAFSARGGPSDVTNAVIVFGTIVFQRGGTNYSTSTGEFIAPVDGIYHFMCNPYRYETSADSQIMLEKSTNGGSSWTYELEIRRTNNYGGDNGRGWSTLSLSQIIDLNANDKVRIRAINRIHCNGTYSRFSGFLVA